MLFKSFFLCYMKKAVSTAKACVEAIPLNNVDKRYTAKQCHFLPLVIINNIT